MQLFSIYSETELSVKHQIRRELIKLVIVNVMNMVAYAIVFSLRVYINAASEHRSQGHHKLSYFASVIVLLIISTLNAMVGILLAIYERLKRQKLKGKMIYYERCNYIHLLVNMICFIAFSVFLIIEFIFWSGSLHKNSKVLSSVQLIIIAMLLVIVPGLALCVLWNRILAWSPKYRFSRAFLFFSSMILVAISIDGLVLNERMDSLHALSEPGDHATLWCYRIAQASASYTLVLGVLGIGLALIYVGRKTHLNMIRNTIRYVFIILYIIGMMLVIASTIILLFYDTRGYKGSNSAKVNMLIHADTVLSVLRCIVLMIEIQSLNRLRKVSQVGRNGLRIERIEMSKQSPDHVKHWAAAIDAYSLTPDGMIGDAALQLMMAYESAQLDDVTSIVLRIVRPARRIIIANGQLDDTEAIVFLTIIHHFDTTVSASLHGSWSTILRRTLGSQNCMPCFRPLVLRLGLLGYHWPFRTGVFLTSPHEDAVSCSASVIQSIIEWNEIQSPALRCNILLLPALSTEPIARAIYSAGFFPLPLPPTHLLDLRPHHGKTWNEYMKTLKRDNRRPYLQQFLNKGGAIEEVHDLGREEVGTIVCDQWKNIAQARQEKNEPPTLMRPSVRLIGAIGNKMAEPYRSIVFLRFNGEVVASSVIFKFPNKLLTTDIQGLTHEKARPIKAYFAMLQWVVREALDKKFDFVDFGPTTPGPKMDLGCIQVPLSAAGYAKNPFVAFGIKKAGGVVDTVHMKKGHHEQRAQEQITDQHKAQQTRENSLHNRVPQTTITSSSCPGTPVGSDVVKTHQTPKNKSSQSNASKVADTSMSIPGADCDLDEFEIATGALDKQVLFATKIQKSAKDKKTVRSDGIDGYQSHSQKERKFRKRKDLTHSTAQTAFPSRDTEHVLNHLPPHNSVDHLKIPPISSNSIADTSNSPDQSSENPTFPMKDNLIQWNNSEAIGSYFQVIEKLPRGQQKSPEPYEINRDNDDSLLGNVVCSSLSPTKNHCTLISQPDSSFANSSPIAIQEDSA